MQVCVMTQKNNAAIVTAGQGARSSLWGSRGEISPLRGGATKRRPARPEKDATSLCNVMQKSGEAKG